MEQEQAKKEIRFKGIPASPGIVIGPVYHFQKHEPLIFVRTIADDEVEKEIERLLAARTRSQKELEKVFEFAEQKFWRGTMQNFEAQKMILEDTVLFDSIFSPIRVEKKNAEYLMKDEIEKYSRLMAASKDEYGRERVNDVQDVCNRVLRKHGRTKINFKDRWFQCDRLS